MALLHIALQEGFVNDTVTIRVNGQEAYAKDNVSTRWQISLADSVELTVPGPTVEIDVSISTRALTKHISVPIAGALHIAISIENNAIVDKFSDTPFGYV